ncbi:ABC transporter permease [Thermoactinomyces sp. DSM 45892]|uniref:ABC transporter permease n=1 Tax=Thermoactinomyces sp. DSM 45892 TaxID=1882753 RepID=UPI000895AB41|nr:ABC transporter permease [Thermoactinomyces sp. DSM 45892]SDY02383.1 putative ABC transport system permease protein [Thermoactinomyces sp. DSM 45892]
MSFRQFALNNIHRNASTYIAYFLSSSFAVMIFFTYLVFIFHPSIIKDQTGQTASYGMIIASYITFIFSFLFVLYSVSAFLKARLREFGILTILGAQRKQLNYLIFLENILIGTASVITGILGGLLFAKLFLLFGENILDFKLPMYPPILSICVTVFAFMALFSIISFMTTIFIRQRKALEMVQGSSKPRKESKASIWLSFLSVASLSYAVYLIAQDGHEKSAALALLFNSIGLYFFFTQLSVVIIRLLNRNRLFSWRGLNLLWITELAYKMKDNARMFFMITMIITISCSTAGSVLAIQNYVENTFTESPFAYTVSQRELDSTKKGISVTQKIEHTLKQKSISYQKLSSNTLELAFQHVGYIRFIRHSEYLEMAKALSLPLVSLQDREALLLKSPLITQKDSLDKLAHLSFESPQLTNSLGNLKIKEQYTKTLFLSEYTAVVNDKTYDQIVSVLSDPDIIDQRYHYLIPSWNNHTIPNTNSIELKTGLELRQWEYSSPIDSTEELDGYINSRAQEYYTRKQLTSIAIFIGLFIVAIFSIFIASFLYFKLFIDLQHDQRYYHELSKMGLSLKEMKRAATKQIAILFYIPLFFAGIQTIVGLSAINPLFSTKTDTVISGLWALGIFTAIQTVYFVIVRARYLAQLKRVMV